MNKKSTQTDVLVILGIDADDKPHAAVFSADNESVVRKAAQMMGMRLGRAADEKARTLALKLPVGTLFTTGKALVPLVKPAIYDELLKVLKLEPSAPNAKEPPAQSSAVAAGNNSKGDSISKVPTAGHDPWADIKVGSVVLGQDDSDEPGWWEAVVVSISKDGDTLTVRWRDYPKQKQATYKRHEVSLLAPQIRTKPARR